MRPGIHRAVLVLRLDAVLLEPLPAAVPGKLPLRLGEVALQRLGELASVAPRAADERSQIAVQVAGAVTDIAAGAFSQFRQRLLSEVERLGGSFLSAAGSVNVTGERSRDCETGFFAGGIDYSCCARGSGPDPIPVIRTLPSRHRTTRGPCSPTVAGPVGPRRPSPAATAYPPGAPTRPRRLPLPQPQHAITLCWGRHPVRPSRRSSDSAPPFTSRRSRQASISQRRVLRLSTAISRRAAASSRASPSTATRSRAACRARRSNTARPVPSTDRSAPPDGPGLLAATVRLWDLSGRTDGPAFPFALDERANTHQAFRPRPLIHILALLVKARLPAGTVVQTLRLQDAGDPQTPKTGCSDLQALRPPRIRLRPRQRSPAPTAEPGPVGLGARPTAGIGR